MPATQPRRGEMGETAHTKGVEQLRSHAGSCVGPYRLIQKVAQGGMATVYLAVEADAPGEPLAVKVMHEHLAADPALVAMFFDEAQIARRIQHANVAPVFDHGSEDGEHYLVMPFVLGETWQRTLVYAANERPRQAGYRHDLTVAHVLHQAAVGLHAAHTATDESGAPLRVVHRDVSAQNLILGYDGVVRVLDFGVAKADSRVHNTHDGSIKGRFAYMAPEQMRGGDVDSRADVWSLGVLLWEALTHRYLFRRGNDSETILAAAYAPIPRVDSVAPRTPGALADVAERALQRHREDRYPTAEAMAEELAAFLIDAGTQPGPDPLRRQMRLLLGDLETPRRRDMAQLTQDVGIIVSDGDGDADGNTDGGARHLPRQAARARKVSGTRRRPKRRALTLSEQPTKPDSPELLFDGHKRWLLAAGAGLVGVGALLGWLLSG